MSFDMNYTIKPPPLPIRRYVPHNLPAEFQSALEEGREDVVQEYLDEVDHSSINELWDWKYSRELLLSIAAIHGHTKIMEILLECGAKVDAVDGKFQTALFLAVQHCQLDAVKLLLDHGAYINTGSCEGRNTPLDWLVEDEKIRRENRFEWFLENDPGKDQIKEMYDYLVSKGAKRQIDFDLGECFVHTYTTLTIWHANTET
ncbi:uncharacterized protein TRUGW13939_09732 [Talaromyces rugulosus]|uniref:Uncharacterized protein n=1 Tax=Talaromyces rugulosus TaxID=121627 RepID=A0A7H8RA02_TALRU|nr:uncharacterized protein TRUGW13939_09732 [Talaromyces rugulosus]QKX62571.1 hypothetical protein TRUGW13939_09732 [Talaromyces rugulosus]